jgi:outer membrane protein assembly factor BamA
MARLLLLWIFLWIGGTTLAQDSLIFIQKVEVKGNKKTKTQYILRELNFAPGDSIPFADLGPRMEFNRLQLMNTGLFSSVEIYIANWEDEQRKAHVRIEVTEPWYIVPVPVFELADRNFNVWWRDYNRSLSRTNYGVNIFHSNLTGRGDLLELLVQFGFTNKYELEYEVPFVDRTQVWGMTMGFLLARNKEINYTTQEDQQVFFRDPDRILLQRLRAQIGITVRPHLRNQHLFHIRYHNNQIDPQVENDLNPYFYTHDRIQQYWAFSYLWTLDKRDIRPYPMHGHYAEVELEKEGFGLTEDINSLYARVLFKQYLSFFEKWSTELVFGGRLAGIRTRQPFANSQALGYGYNYLRGYEYYVIDGLDYGFSKVTLRREILNTTFNWGNLVPFDSFRLMPTRLYLVAYNDLGYVNNPFYGDGNRLANDWLASYGLGLHLVAYYNRLFQLEFSRNRLGENGVYLHWQFRF